MTTSILGFNQLNLPPVLPMVRQQVDQMTVQNRAADLNTAICNEVAAGVVSAHFLQLGITGSATCTRRDDPGFNVAADIQNTAPGGSPHPSTRGHAKLATLVITRLR